MMGAVDDGSEIVISGKIRTSNFMFILNFSSVPISALHLHVRHSRNYSPGTERLHVCPEIMTLSYYRIFSCNIIGAMRDGHTLKLVIPSD